ncbi:MAG: DsrE/DsrF/DrsH-like family protein [Desulfomicrobium sp.]|jgi:peroxiredoxin family protein|nr:DsrE/DsrF/DrsH-like family protein [Desulfomicrobium sp.]
MDNLNHLAEQVQALRKELDQAGQTGQEDKLSMILFSGDLDKALAAFIIATGAVAMGLEVVIFLTFWGTPLFRKSEGRALGKDLMSKMFGWMLPKGAAKASLSQMHMAGAGTQMLKTLMTKKNVASLAEMITLAGQLGVKVYICEMSMNLMGFRREEMIAYPELQYAGVATFLAEAKKSKIQLFI